MNSWAGGRRVRVRLTPTLHVEIARAPDRDPRPVRVSSYQRRRRLLSRLPLPESAGLSVRLSSLLLPCVQGLGSLSLPFPPPPLPTYDPTLRPHPSSLCQSGAAQPCRGAGAAGEPDPPPAAGIRAGGCTIAVAALIHVDPSIRAMLQR